MTFRPETNPKEENDQKSKEDTLNGTADGGANNISTIYNPQQQCGPTSLPPSFNAVPVHKTLPDITRPKRTVVETIKKFTLKLKSQNDDDPDDMQKRRIRCLKWTCLGVVLACKLVLMVAILVLVFRSVQRPESRNIIVDGEFQILNKKFEFDLLDKQSTAFKELASNLTNELNKLFKKSDVGEYFVRSEILEITPNMTVRSIAIFRGSDYINVGRIGLAFLRSLRLQHGHTYLGIHTINVQSIGFQIRGEEGIWGEWSNWNGCDSPNDYVATRIRKCLTKDTLQVTDVDRCLLIPGKKSDLDIMPCSKFRSMKQKLDASTSNSYDTIKEPEDYELVPDKTQSESINMESSIL